MFLYYGENNSPDSTSNTLNKRRRLESETRSRSSTPILSSQENSPIREASSDKDSVNEHVTKKKYQSFYRARSASISKSRSRSRSISRSRSRSSRSMSSKSRSNSRSLSPVIKQSKNKRVVQSGNIESDSDDDKRGKNVPTQNLGLDISESEEEDGNLTVQADNRVSKRVAKEAS